MADLTGLEEIWRQSLKLNMRYYSAVTRLTATYVKDLTTLFTELRDLPLKPQAIIETPSAPHAAQHSNVSGPKASVMVLEGEAGSTALGVFLIANNLGHDVLARVVASEFSDAHGRTIQSTFAFDPDVVKLAPNEQILVRVTTAINDSLEPEVRYAGEFTIPELSGTRIPIVLRRRPEAETPTDGAQVDVDISPEKNKSPGRSKKSKGSSGDSATRGT